jgi:hypothetical protein
MKKLLYITLVLFGALCLSAQEEDFPWQKDITMIMVPRNELTLQVVQDISRRYPVMLICYQLTPAAPLLHAWNGEEWVGVRVTDYINGTFFTNRPQHAIIVEKKGFPAPDVLIPDGTWCGSGNRLSSTETRAVIHLLGRYFNFPYRYWMQFAKRYNYPLEQINPGLLNVPFVHYRGDQVVPAFKARDFDRDMDKWSKLKIIAHESIEPVMIMEELKASVTPADVPAEEVSDELISMPEEQPVTDVEEAIQSVEENTASPSSTDQPEDSKNSESAALSLVSEIDPFSTNDIPAAQIILPSE